MSTIEQIEEHIKAIEQLTEKLVQDKKDLELKAIEKYCENHPFVYRLIGYSNVSFMSCVKPNWSTRKVLGLFSSPENAYNAFQKKDCHKIIELEKSTNITLEEFRELDKVN